jgi:progesterone-induced-blocking factor 1
MSEIRVQYRLKAEEYERLQTIYEETLANLKATKVENEMLRDKLNVLKSEYYKAELSSKEEYSTMKAQLVICRNIIFLSILSYICFNAIQNYLISVL